MPNAMNAFLDWLAPHRCLACGAAVPGAHPFCASCESMLEPLPGYPLGPHEGPARDTVTRLKFRPEGPALRRLARYVAPRLQLDFPGRWWLCPVPTQAPRIRERGGDAMQQLARHLGHALGWPSKTLLRRRPGPAQRSLDRAARLKAAHGAFDYLQRRWPRAALNGILLLDDVRTTGATLEAARYTLQGLELPVEIAALTVALHSGAHV